MQCKKRLVIAERAKFLATSQKADELASFHRYCGFEKLKRESQTIKEELVQMGSNRRNVQCNTLVQNTRTITARKYILECPH